MINEGTGGDLMPRDNSHTQYFEVPTDDSGAASVLEEVYEALQEK